MQVTGLFHVRDQDQRSRCDGEVLHEVLGMKLVHRPDFGFPAPGLRPGQAYRSFISTPAGRRSAPTARRLRHLRARPR